MGEKNRPLFVPSPSLLDEYLPMIVTDQHGVRRRPLLRGTITLTLPAVLLLLVLITRNLFFVELSPTDIDQGISGETHVDGGKVVDAEEAEEAYDANEEEDTYEAYEAPEPAPPRPELAKYPQEWMLEAAATMAHIDNNISRFKCREAFDESFDKLRHGFIVRIEDGQMYAMAKMLPGTAAALHMDWNQYMRESAQPPMELRPTLWPLCRRGLIGDPTFDIDFAVSVPDEPVNTIFDAAVPVFGWVKTGLDTDLLIPYPYSYNSLHSPLVSVGWDIESIGRLDQLCYNESLAHVSALWDAKIEKGIWRGSTTGTERFTTENWRDQWRPKLVKYCMEHEDVCDAAISGIVQADGDAADEMRRELPVGEEYRMSELEQSEYKYALLLDGNSAPSSRTVTALGQASAIVKQSSPFMEFFYHSLRPYVHYLPMPNEIGEDISRVINWAREHDDEIKQMVVRASSFKCRWLHDEIVEQYVADLVQMYADRFHGTRGSIKTEDMIPIHIDCAFNQY